MKQLFINGEYKDSTQPVIYAQDRGFLLADGIFETLFSQNGHIFYFNQHFNRFNQTAEFFAIPVPYSQLQLAEICHELLNKNELINTTAALRISLTRGIGERGIALPAKPHPTLLITATAYLREVTVKVRAAISSIKRNEYSSLIQYKTLQYLENVLARKQANEQGYDEAILQNTKNNLTETSIGNLFLVINKEVITPPINDGILPGIIRQRVIEHCQKSAIPVKEQSLSHDCIKNATEAFHTNSLIGIQSIASINDIQFHSTEVANLLQSRDR